jgi:cleavage and polyadenylation specificity factor subunit 1
LLVLFEPLKTYSGRVLLRPDTCSMIAMSLNTYDGSHPVIWSVAGLPFDCFQAVPVSRPIGGCLIVAVNSLIYLNQSMPPYGVAVNCIPATTTGFPLKPLTQEGVSLSMDCARIAVVKVKVH